MSRAMPGLTSITLFMAYFGLVVLIVGDFINSEAVQFHTQAYLAFFLPTLLLLLLKWKTVGRMLSQNRALQCYSLLLLWFGISLLWTTFDNWLHIVKLLVMLWSLAVVVRLLLGNLDCFSIAIGAALLVLAVTAMWTVSHYLQATGANFYAQRLDYFGMRSLNPVLVGLVAANLMLYCLFFAGLVGARWLRIIYLVMACAFIGPILISFARTAWIGLLSTVIWYQFVSRHYKIATTLSLLTMALLGLMLADVSQQWLITTSRSLSMEIRLWGWQQTLELIREHWLIGYGVRAPFSVSWEGTPLAAINPELYQPHNIFLAIWYEAGLVGLLLFLVLLGLIVQTLRERWFAIEIRYFSCLCFFIMTTCLVDRPELIDRPSAAWVWFWLPLAVAISADKLSAKQPADAARDSAECDVPVVAHL